MKKPLKQRREFISDILTAGGGHLMLTLVPFLRNNTAGEEIIFCGKKNILNDKSENKMESPYKYKVSRLKGSFRIDGNTDKMQWKKAKAVGIKNILGARPSYEPETTVKMLYDGSNIYVLFSVKDKFVRCITDRINGPVWADSCVEFFFAPDSNNPQWYFNIEVNCGGTPLVHYNLVPRKDFLTLSEEEIRQIEIAHSLPPIVDPEITDEVIWNIEYKVPLKMLEKYSKVTYPARGVKWRANFYKIAENNSSPHYITWAPVNIPKPDFHRPEFFGELYFSD